MNLLGFIDFVDVLPFLFVPIVFVVAFVVIIVAVVKRAAADKRNREMSEYKSQNFFNDGNGRTQQQRDYLAKKRAELSERKIRDNDMSTQHSHTGTTERYESIVGSLGEVYDEGCYELDGVRLLEHDEAYCDEPDHMDEVDYSDLQKAIVMGEVVNTPRFKQMYGRKK